MNKKELFVLPGVHTDIYEGNNRERLDHEHWINYERLPHSAAHAKFFVGGEENRLSPPRKKRLPEPGTHSEELSGGVFVNIGAKGATIRGLGNRNHCF